MRLILLSCIVIAQLAWAAAVQARDAVLVFAPASMTDVLNDLRDLYQQKSGNSIVISFAGTQHLARQLDAGAPADLFITADRDWMDWAAERDLIKQQRIVPLAGNRLVVAVRNEVENWADIDGLFTQDYFAMAEPDSVPAGRYARQALQHRGLWQKAKPRAVFGDNVRTTLRRLARGEVTSAIVYGTDAAIESRVRSLFVFPPDSHDAITYWLAATGDAVPEKVTAFIQFLNGPEAGAIFASAGFTPPPQKGD
ncbi:MAG: molybdate ABC transporter substrate-binding protein [Rhizobiaceae bacterium]